MMGLFGQSKVDILRLTGERGDGLVECEKCGHLIRKVRAKQVLVTYSFKGASTRFYGLDCAPGYDQIAHINGEPYYFRKVPAQKTADDIRVNEDGSSYYEAMGAVSDLPTPLPYTREILRETLYSKYYPPKDDAVTSVPEGDMELKHARRLLKKVKAHLEALDNGTVHTARAKNNHELACEIRSFFGERS